MELECRARPSLFRFATPDASGLAPGALSIRNASAAVLAEDSTMSKSLGPKSGRVDQAERFFDTAQAHGGGASAERFAELVSAIAASRLPKSTPVKPKRKPVKLIRLKCGR